MRLLAQMRVIADNTMDLGTRKIQGLGNDGHGSTRDKAQRILQRVQQLDQRARARCMVGNGVLEGFAFMATGAEPALAAPSKVMGMIFP
jgi:hypothetical protein